MISSSKRKELREALEKSTQGEWVWDEPSNWLGLSARVFCREPYGVVATVDIEAWRPRSIGKGNAKFIVLAHNSMRDLLDAIDEIEKERDDLQRLFNTQRHKTRHAADGWAKDIEKSEAELLRLKAENETLRKALEKIAYDSKLDEVRDIAKGAIA